MSDEYIPNLDIDLVDVPTNEKLGNELKATHKPRIVLLMGRREPDLSAACLSKNGRCQ